MSSFLPHISINVIVAIEVLTAVCLDRIFGEPRMAHPLVGFGNLAQAIERFMLVSFGQNSNITRRRILFNVLGIVSVATAIVPCVTIILFVQRFLHWDFMIAVVALYLSIGAKSLAEHALCVEAKLNEGSLEQARAKVALIVSRNTEEMEAADVARATIESVLENGNDAVFGAIFWFIACGPAGAVLYRLANTLDAMWGYKNDKYVDFGWAAARLDDILNFIPARLTALTYAICGHFFAALRCWKKQAPTWYSPNAGPVMASGAGALLVSLGGAAKYHGLLKQRPVLGEGPTPVAADIVRSVKLVENGLVLWVLFIIVLGVLNGIN